MTILENDEIILLNSFIYLEWDAEEDEKLIDLVKEILTGNTLDKIMERNTTCKSFMKKEEYTLILKNMLKKKNLKGISIKYIITHDDGMKAACFVNDDMIPLVVFRGTTTMEEWEDNGEGAYEYDTRQQISAINYIKKLPYEKVIVTGHSKGGNKAMYTAILSPQVEKCISINGHGFSKEFLKKYNDKIEENKDKIISINSKYDYINCLFYSIAGEREYIKTPFQINPLLYHKANIMIDENGNIREKTSRSIFNKIINDFTILLINDLPQDLKPIVADGIISGIEFFFCRDNLEYDSLKIFLSFITLFTYGSVFKKKEKINILYTMIEMLLIPLFIYEELIDTEENMNNEKLDNIVHLINEKKDKSIERVKDKKSLAIINKNINKLIENITALKK